MLSGSLAHFMNARTPWGNLATEEVSDFQDARATAKPGNETRQSGSRVCTLLLFTVCEEDLTDEQCSSHNVGTVEAKTNPTYRAFWSWDGCSEFSQILTRGLGLLSPHQPKITPRGLQTKDCDVCIGGQFLVRGAAGEYSGRPSQRLGDGCMHEEGIGSKHLRLHDTQCRPGVTTVMATMATPTSEGLPVWPTLFQVPCSH